MSKERKKAVALRYKPEEKSAPRVTAKGEGEIAEKIIALAKEYGIAIHEDRDLVSVLSKLDLNEEIPEELYKTVAEILVFIYEQNKELAEKKL